MPLHNKTGKRYSPKPMQMKYADKENEQIYGTVDKAMGNCHFTVNTINNETKTASLCGILKKRGKIRNGDIVLIEPLSEDTDKKYQIIFKYAPHQKKILEKEGHLKVVSDNVEEKVVENEMFAFEDDNTEQKDNVQNINESFIDGI